MELNIDALRLRSKLNISENLFSKDELKTIFIFNYGGKNGLNLVPLLNNNMTFQCFRNAAFYLMSRLELDIWETIDTLPNVNNFEEITSEHDKNKYIIIQTFIELMDNNIINNTITNSEPIEQKRTHFIDNRFNMLEVNNNIKYNTFGVLIDPVTRANYKPSYMGPTENGSVSEVVIAKLNSFLKGTNSFCVDLKGAPIVDLTTCKLTESTPNYIIVKLKPDIVSMTSFFNNISDNKIRLFNDQTYKLVGITYDCPKGIQHQVTSLCRGDNCISEIPKHNFFDDKHNKGLLELRSTVASSLEWGCNQGGINITAALYEKEDTMGQLETKISEFISGHTFKKSDSVIFPNISTIYANKYMKYKNKYLKLKQSLGL